MMPGFYRAPRHKRAHRHHPGHERREAREQRGEGGRDLRTSKLFYWITGVFRGKRFLYGPCESEWQATQLGASKMSGDYQILPLNTRDEATASRMLKAKLLEKEEFGEATRRLSHQ